MSRIGRLDSFHPQPARRLRWPNQAVLLTALLGAFAFGALAGGVFAIALWRQPGFPAHTERGVAGQAQRASADKFQLGRYPAEVLRVIDGDTFEARIHVWMGQELVLRVRLRGIDAPELKARSVNEREQAEAAANALRAMLSDRDIAIWDVGPDKYFGRVVARAGTRATSDVSAALLAKGLVRGYAGGHRDGWCDQVARR
jgi:endonuclease YncB( thermonuclease family)